MALLNANVLTLADWAKRLDPDGKTSMIVELLSQTNEVLADQLWMEGNLPTGHRTSVRTSLPTSAWRLLNNGVQPSKSTTAQVDEGCAILEAWSEVDKDLAELNGNTAAFRLSEAQAFIESMNQEYCSTLFYGNAGSSPEEFTGLSARYSDPTATNGSNVIDAGASGSDNSSVWLICWGAQSIFGIFPKGSKAGLQHNDLGLVTVETTAAVAGTRMRAYQDMWQWKCGIALRDWRYVCRLGSIDISDLVGKSSAADLIDGMIKMIHRIPNIRMGKPVFYMNRSVLQMLDIQRRDDIVSGGGLTYQNDAGQLQPSFRGIPVRCVDALTETETKV
jgi:hypothetical protein